MRCYFCHDLFTGYYCASCGKTAIESEKKWKGKDKIIDNKYIVFEEYKKSPKHKTVRVNILKKHTREQIGEIYWDSGWRQYVWSTWNCIKWSWDCTQHVVNKIQELNKKQKEKKSEVSE